MRRFVFILLLLAFSCVAADAQQSRPLKEQLAGTWSLVKWWNVVDDGHEMPPPVDGRDMKGLLMFDANGRYSLVIASERPRWKSTDTMEGTPEENTAAAGGTLAYFGTYSVSDAENAFTLHVERSLHPNINGTDQRRFFSISGDEVTVRTPTFKYPKGTFTGYFVWVKEK